MLQSYRGRVNYHLLLTERTRKTSKWLLGPLLSFREIEEHKNGKDMSLQICKRKIFFVVVIFVFNRSLEQVKEKSFTGNLAFLVEKRVKTLINKSNICELEVMAEKK